MHSAARYTAEYGAAQDTVQYGTVQQDAARHVLPVFGAGDRLPPFSTAEHCTAHDTLWNGAARARRAGADAQLRPFPGSGVVLPIRARAADCRRAAAPHGPPKAMEHRQSTELGGGRVDSLALGHLHYIRTHFTLDRINTLSVIIQDMELAIARR